uniref:Uncharacterized protein n=1 Tax=Arundo donax TaxID=35708 RepID=A0A0A8Z1V6_ARUDO
MQYCHLGELDVMVTQTNLPTAHVLLILKDFVYLYLTQLLGQVCKMDQNLEQQVPSCIL